MSITNVHSKWVRGALVFYQDHLKRFVDAVGKDVVKYIDDFISMPVDDQTGDPTAFTMTVVEAGTGNSTASSTDASGGALLITTDDNDNDGVNLQLNGESFIFKSTNDVYIGIFGVTVGNATQSDFFLGLCPTDTAVLTNDTARVGFQKVDASTDIKAMAGQTADVSAALGTLADGVAVDLELYWNGTALESFINGASTGAVVVTNIPTGECRVTLEFLNGLADAPATCQIDKVVVIQVGR